MVTALAFVASVLSFHSALSPGATPVSPRLAPRRAATATAARLPVTMGMQDPVADQRELHAAFRREARQAHPDAPGGSVEAFQRVTEEYERLRSSSTGDTTHRRPKGMLSSAIAAFVTVVFIVLKVRAFATISAIVMLREGSQRHAPDEASGRPMSSASMVGRHFEGMFMPSDGDMRGGSFVTTGWQLRDCTRCVSNHLRARHPPSRRHEHMAPACLPSSLTVRGTGRFAVCPHADLRNANVAR